MNKAPKPEYCPDWFDLSLYENLINFNRTDWTIAMFSRHIVYKDFNKRLPTEKEIVEFEKYYITGLVQQIDTVRKKEADLEFECVTKLDLFDVLVQYEHLFLSNDIELQSTFDEVRKEILERKEEFIDGGYTPLEFLDILSRDGINREFLDDGRSLALNIELSFSDQAIIESVQSHLKKAREKSKNKDCQNGKRISDTEIESLIRYRVIPYIDLMLWGMITGQKLTDQKIADILFSDDPDGKGLDTIRKTTKRKALNLLSQVRPKFL
ncbi:hypothetical protein C2831_06295 [Pasteurella multocida]|uniref:DUF6387 family protein n=1 Tax=Pasteurella multocida TaxID=747 RepID=UPI000259159D|nr:DUF6387 family protein [Pasteurella multocida]AFI46741.1 hypothetical protein NT08PM_1625 [Pasteurella multocida subsp. multocida str. 3480]MCL7793440.1 DUF6387 family protein [Pasteurella multocida]MDY0661728.1 DUF6387 family protein [Pasteurella multocida]NNH97875.1 hypothetical protein [Pasteurella multocida]NNI08693.1 hypothetical protein [Pasteurella multocida]